MKPRSETVKERQMRQGYRRHPEHPTCRNCVNFTSSTRKIKGMFGPVAEEVKPICRLGSFSVNRGGVCDEHQPKEGVQLDTSILKR